MSKPMMLQNQFTSGMKRDYPRNRMPPNSAWTLKDVVLEYGAPARERAGWTTTGASVSSVTSTASYVRAGIYAIFSPTAGALGKNLILDEDGKFYCLQSSAVTAGNAITALGQSNVAKQNPVFHGGAAASAASAVNTGLVIMPDGNGAASPYVYDGTTLSAMHGTPPKARYAAVYKDYTALANGAVGSVAYPNRVWFSPAGDPDCFGSSGVSAWDTTDAWVDFSSPVRGLASTKNALLVFCDGQISRIRGSVPPPDTDFTIDDPWQQLGLLSAFSIHVHEDIVYWCAPEGVFRSDGVYLDNITLKGGMLRYWLDKMANADSGYEFAIGVVRNQLVISILDNGTFHDAFMVDLSNYSWVQISNLDATSFWDGQRLNTVNDDTFFGQRSRPSVGRLDSMFAEVGDVNYMYDGNSTAVVSIVETPFYELGRPGIKSIKGLHIGYQLTDFSALHTDPTVAVSYLTSPEATAYTSLGTLAENLNYDRKRIQLGGRFYGLALKFARVGAGDFLGYDLSAEVNYQEESKRMS